MSPETAADRCPGLLRPHAAADGALVRLRVPGGALTASSLARVAAASGLYADGAIRMTSRANLQLRGVATDASGRVPAGLVDAVAEAGLLPSASHERVRNIMASPLSGFHGGTADVRPLVGQLDRLLCADPALADLPGRFLLGIDDGRGDVAGLRCDLTLVCIDPRTAQVVVGDGVVGPRVALAEAAEQLTALAGRFLRERTDEWRVAQLPKGGRELLDEVGGALPPHADHQMPYGLVPQPDGRMALSLLVPLGTVNREQADTLVVVARAGSDRLVVTPWRGIVVPDLPPTEAAKALERLTAVALVADGASAWTGITACVGAPGCVSAQGDTTSMAHRIAAGHQGDEEMPVHVVGCDRRCGAPSTPHRLVMVRSTR